MVLGVKSSRQYPALILNLHIFFLEDYKLLPDAFFSFHVGTDILNLFLLDHSFWFSMYSKC